MAYDPFHIAELITAHFQGILTDSQRVELNIWLEAEENRAFLKQMSDQEDLPKKLLAFERSNEQDTWNKTLHGLQQLNVPELTLVKPNFLRYKLLAIAAAIALIVLGVYFFNYQEDPKMNSGQAVVLNDIAPGKIGATLTLSNGKKIRLTEATHGELAQESGITISKAADGQLVYEIKGNSTERDKINTLTTDKGETYQVHLPDGSVVWLNAASSLTYRADLKEGAKRRVKLEGEGYFEIAKDKIHPFVVESKGQEVEVLGTHFNVNAYADEAVVATTLLEGAVKVTSNQTGQVLKPGEQALSNGQAIKVAKVNVENVIDWKAGDFYFEHVDFRSVMREIGRWYDVEVIYDAVVPENITSNGLISRNNKLSAVLKSIEKSGQVHFKIEGKKVYVTK